MGILSCVLRVLRHYFVLALFLLLPFHALFVTAGTNILAGPGHAPMIELVIWKELLIAIILFVGSLELFFAEEKIITQIFTGKVRWKWDLSNEKWMVILLLGLAFTLLPSNNDFVTFVYGFKYVFIPLIFFLLMMTLTWEEDFLERKILPALLVTGVIVAGYGIVTFFLPINFFTALGYSDTHSLYTPSGPLSAFQQISDTGIRRIQSTMSGPNQLGVWLLMPWSISVVSLLRRRSTGYWLFVTGLIGLAIFLTFSRSAWIAAFVITLIACSTQCTWKTKKSALVGIIGVTIVGIFAVWNVSPDLIQRGISNRHHLERTRSGIIDMIKKPFGHGLGTAGPASNRTSDACLYFPARPSGRSDGDAGADISWAKDRSDLCLFVGKTQVQPPPDERECVCPVLPENWYVQIGYELGIPGFVLFLILIMYVSKRLHRSGRLPVFLAFLGVSIAAVFLHAWEDSAVAYTVWGVAGMVLSRGSWNGITE